MDRRQFLEIAGRSFALASVVGALPRGALAQHAPPKPGAPAAPSAPTVRKGRIKHSVCRWCYGGDRKSVM